MPNHLFSELSLISQYSYTKQDNIALDVGAHQGIVSLTFINKGWKVIAFEPERNNRAALLNNITLTKKFICLSNAVSDITGDKIPFYVSREHYGIHSLKPWHKTHQLAYNVETIRLDDALNELSVNNVTLLKIDIEGADFLALKSFDFNRFKPELVMVEFMDERSKPNFGYTHHDMVAYMLDRGYSTFVSEWAAIKEYGRENIKTEPHQWLQCKPYPLDHEPAWGNLIFVPHHDVDKFSTTLNVYLKRLKSEMRWIPLKSFIHTIPGAVWLYRLIKQ